MRRSLLVAWLSMGLVSFPTALSEESLESCSPETSGDCEGEEADLVRVSLLQTRLTPPERAVLLGASQEPDSPNLESSAEGQESSPSAASAEIVAPSCSPPYAARAPNHQQNCMGTRTCCDPSQICYEKGNGWAGCLSYCTPGIHSEELRRYQSPWSCRVLSVAGQTTQPPQPQTTSTTTTTTATTTTTTTTAATAPPPAATTAYVPPMPRPSVVAWKDGSLASPSSAPLLTFYIYRAVNGQAYQPLNVNAGNLAGVLWYLQNEVEVTPWAPKFWINKIERYTFRYRPSQSLVSTGMNFGVRYSFDSGLCTGPFDCNAQFKKYGYFLGCNTLGSWPFPEFQTGYPTGIWYSIPGECPSKKFFAHDGACQSSEPGGFCPGIPTGTGDCQFNFEKSGEIQISELEGSRGHSFWDNVYDQNACAARVLAAEELFRKKYPTSPDYPTPPCDFVRERFYNEGFPPPL